MTTRERFRLKRALAKQIKAEQKSLRDFFASPTLKSSYTKADIECMIETHMEEVGLWMK